MIQSVFPIPLGIYSLEKPLYKSELKYFNSLDVSKKNVGNHISVAGHILEDKKMNRLKKFFIDSLKDYASHTYDFKDDVELYITQSWVNISKPEEYHHKHKHPNSMVSGVFYIDADDEKDIIQFWQCSESNISRGNAYNFNFNDFNDFNSDVWWMPSITGRLYLFPSGLKHDVPVVKGRTKDRISLSFNTFLKGTLGSDFYKTELIL